MRASIFLPTLFEESKGAPHYFLLCYALTDIHETLHLLLKKLGIRGYSSEAQIERLSRQILNALITNEGFADSLAHLFSDVLQTLKSKVVID